MTVQIEAGTFKLIGQDDTLDHARNSFEKKIRLWNAKQPEDIRLSLHRDGDGYCRIKTNELWAMFLAGYKSALEQTK